MTDQTPDDTQAARLQRREPLLVLLNRMQRGVLLEQERDLLRAAVETELRDGDMAHEQAANEQHWGDLARADRDALRKQVDQLTARLGECADRAIANGERAATAEAAIARVRARIADDFRHDHRALIEAALDGEQPAEPEPEPIAPEPTPCNAYQPSSSPEESGLCASCGMADWKHTAEPEIEPLRIPEQAARDLHHALGKLLGEPEPDAVHTHLTDPQPILIRIDLVNVDRALREAIRRTFRNPPGSTR